MTELSKSATEICEEHYSKRCGHCPLRPACVTPVPWGREALDSYTNEVNELAEKIKEE